MNKKGVSKKEKAPKPTIICIKIKSLRLKKDFLFKCNKYVNKYPFIQRVLCFINAFKLKYNYLNKKFFN